MDGHKMSLWVVMRLQRPVTPAFDRLICRGLLKDVILNKRNKGIRSNGVMEFDKSSRRRAVTRPGFRLNSINSKHALPLNALKSVYP
jgi:hypothetical protein